MSCDGWGVGDKFESNDRMEISVTQNRFVSLQIIRSGTVGKVKSINRKTHEMKAYIAGIDGIANLSHSNVHNLTKI